MADEVWAWCEKARAFGRTVTVKIKYADFRQITHSRTLHAIVTSQETLRGDLRRGLLAGERHDAGRPANFPGGLREGAGRA